EVSATKTDVQPNKTKPRTKPQRYSCVMTGTPTTLIPENNDRMARRASRRRSSKKIPARGNGDGASASSRAEQPCGPATPSKKSQKHTLPLHVVSSNLCSSEKNAD